MGKRPGKSSASYTKGKIRLAQDKQNLGLLIQRQAGIKFIFALNHKEKLDFRFWK